MSTSTDLCKKIEFESSVFLSSEIWSFVISIFSLTLVFPASFEFDLSIDFRWHRSAHPFFCQICSESFLVCNTSWLGWRLIWFRIWLTVALPPPACSSSSRRNGKNLAAPGQWSRGAEWTEWGMWGSNISGINRWGSAVCFLSCFQQQGCCRWQTSPRQAALSSS